ncbi:MAG TPA: hypothetical protein VHT03_11825 [Rhizomicrobium sp.]|nr:hypothetical protein [Rhizomicrobium sp.]
MSVWALTALIGLVIIGPSRLHQPIGMNAGIASVIEFESSKMVMPEYVFIRGFAKTINGSASLFYIGSLGVRERSSRWYHSVQVAAGAKNGWKLLRHLRHSFRSTGREQVFIRSDPNSHVICGSLSSIFQIDMKNRGLTAPKISFNGLFNEDVRAQLPLLRVTHDFELVQENYSRDESENGGQNGSYASEPRRHAFTRAWRVLWILGLCAVICGIAAYKLGQSSPHLAWVPLATFAVLAVIACVLLGHFANQMGAARASIRVPHLVQREWGEPHFVTRYRNLQKIHITTGFVCLAGVFDKAISEPSLMVSPIGAQSVINTSEQIKNKACSRPDLLHSNGACKLFRKLLPWEKYNAIRAVFLGGLGANLLLKGDIIRRVPEGNQLHPDSRCKSWKAANIFQLEIHPDKIDPGRVGQVTRDFWRDIHPRSLLGLQFIQLPLHDVFLLVKNRCLLAANASLPPGINRKHDREDCDDDRSNGGQKSIVRIKPANGSPESAYKFKPYVFGGLFVAGGFLAMLWGLGTALIRSPAAFILGLASGIAGFISAVHGCLVLLG